MVRLLVPEGEAQLPFLLRPPGAAATQSDLIAAPWRSSLAAAFVTGGLALVGRSRPGVFLKSAALISAVDLTWTASGIYGRHELNRGVFMIESIQPKPGKLWEQTKHWTSEDATLAGGALGIFMALNPRALPGAYGFSRFFGAATVGCALGFKVGQAFVVRLPSPLLHLFDQTVIAARQKEYEKLQDDERAKASLSRIGRLALWYHSSMVMGILRSPLQIGGIGGVGGMSGGPVQTGHGGTSGPGGGSLAALKAEIESETVVQAEFKEGELAGPDVENGYRSYRDDLVSRDASKVQEWLEQVQALKKKVGAELQYVWPHLAQREHEFYQLVQEDREKDIFRRELQLLNNMASDLAVRYAILEYHEHDAQKQLQQITQADPVGAELDTVSQDITKSFETPRYSAGDTQMNFQGPTTVTERVRTTWSRQKELLRHYEHRISQANAIQPGEGTPVAEHIKHLQQDAEQMRKNIEATERLLRWFEEPVREADEVVKDDTRQDGV
ncbi:hypothetical protein G6011_02057 [Alternaria panax]|uniref:Uncharacterized protein n=1 Tax=Alternaria panax TaxID=48097 RepID=A0AAD4FIE2_9PLEO|nr:hypothetical protein G6011_02057 [Alternaria panax]